MVYLVGTDHLSSISEGDGEDLVPKEERSGEERYLF